MRDAFANIADTTRREPGRAFLTLFGIALGTASIVFLVSLMGGAKVAIGRLEHRATGDDLDRINRDDANAAPGKTVLPLTATDAEALLRKAGSETPSDMVYKYRLRRVNARVGDKTKVVGLDGGGSAYARQVDLELLHGRWLDPSEDGERLCLVGYDIWQDLFEGAWPLTKSRIVLDNSVSLKVVGIFAHRADLGDGDGPQTWKLDRKIWVSNATFRMAIEPRSDLDEILLRHHPDGDELPDVKAIARGLDSYLASRHLGVRNFTFAALESDDEGLGGVIALAIGGVLSLAAVFSLLVGGVNVMNAELMKLAERTREYGIRRALGATARELGRGLVVETMIFCAVGGVAGVCLGVLGAWLLSLVLSWVLTPWPFIVAPWSVLTALVASLVVGLLAGLSPARRAQRLVIVECLRQAD